MRSWVQMDGFSVQPVPGEDEQPLGLRKSTPSCGAEPEGPTSFLVPAFHPSASTSSTPRSQKVFKNIGVSSSFYLYVNSKVRSSVLYPKLSSNSWSFHFRLLNVGLTGVWPCLAILQCLNIVIYILENDGSWVPSIGGIKQDESLCCVLFV